MVLLETSFWDVVWWILILFLFAICEQFSNRFAHVAFTVDQELPRNDDLLALGETRSHLDPSVTRVESELDIRWTESTFASGNDLVNHLVAGVLMGFGGVLAVGCTIGQGIVGMSTLAVGSLLALGSIIAGCALTIKMQYHLLDSSLSEALHQMLVDIRLLSGKSND